MERDQLATSARGDETPPASSPADVPTEEILVTTSDDTSGEPLLGEATQPTTPLRPEDEYLLDEGESARDNGEAISQGIDNLTLSTSEKNDSP